MKDQRPTAKGWQLLRLVAVPVEARVVRDGNLVTGGGVTAGIDFALTLTAQVRGEAHARLVQLALEYDPQPPFDAGSPERAGEALVAQYNAYEVLPGLNVNGKLTLGENIADNAGAIMASRAYRISLNGKPAPVIDGFTAEQRLFMGLAQARRGKARDAALISQVKSDPHSPAEFRVNGSLRNHPGYYEAFDVKPGDKMYLKPEERVIFW